MRYAPIHRLQCSRLSPGQWSVRTRLVVWNSMALALLLGVLGLAAHYSVRTLMYASVDRELAVRTARFTRGPGPRFGQPGSPPPGPPSDNEEAPPNRRQHEMMQPDFRAALPGGWLSNPPFFAPNGPPRREQDPLAPRLIDRDGKVMGPGNAEPVVDPKAVGRALMGRDVYTIIVSDGQRFRVLTRPLGLRQPIPGVVQVQIPLAEVDRAIAGLAGVLLALIPVAVLCAGLGGYLLTGRVLRPVREVTQAAATIGAEDLSDRLPVVGTDEFAKLSATFNEMLARLEGAFGEQARMLEELRRMVEQQRRFTADASHELRTPLTVIKANTSLALSDGEVTGETRQSMDDIDQAADRMSRLVQDLLLLARSDGGQLGRNRTPVALKSLLARAVSHLAYKGSAAVNVCEPVPNVCVEVNEDEMARVFLNLLENAVRYTPGGGSIRVQANVVRGVVRVSVSDTGIGIAPEHLAHLGERFYRVDASRSRPDGGTGLGLSICKGIVEAHGGAIQFESEPGAGTTVTVSLPALSPIPEPTDLAAFS